MPRYLVRLTNWNKVNPTVGTMSVYQTDDFDSARYRFWAGLKNADLAVLVDTVSKQEVKYENK